MAAKQKKKKRRKSLSKAVQRLVFFVALLIFAASTFLNWGFHSLELMTSTSLSARNASIAIKTAILQEPGFEQFANSVMNIYADIPEEIRQAQGEEYFSYFEPLLQSDTYQDAAAILENVDHEFILENGYVAMYDQDTSRLVYILDPKEKNEEYIYRTGEWKEVSKEEKEKASALFSENRNREGNDDLTLNYRGKTEVGGDVITSGYPLEGEDDRVYALAFADVPMVTVTTMATVYTVLYIIILLIIIAIVVLIARLMMRKRIVIPIRKISDAATAYVQDRKDGKSDSIIFGNLSINTGDELEELCNVMTGMETDISAYEEDLMNAAAEQEKLKTELSVAARIQDDLLPTIFPAFPDRKDFDIYAVMDPAKEIGGDFYDFFLIDDDHLGLVMADVSGKGIPAALFMMSSMIIINNFASEGYSPSMVLQKTNERICSTNLTDMFVTAWFGILDLKTGVVIASNAGHEYPAIRHAGGKFELFKDRHGFVLGGMNGMKYTEYTFTLEPGSSLFLYTDGVVEAANSSDMLYKTGRMLAALNTDPDAPPRQLLTNVRKDIDSFVQDAPQFDDLTMLAVQYYGPEKNKKDEVSSEENSAIMMHDE